jgi:hypothetical protein
MPFEGDEDELVADVFAVAVIATLAALFLLHERPRLIDLDIGNGNVRHLPPQKCFAIFTGQLKDAENRPLLDFAETGGTANRVALDKAMQDHADLLIVKANVTEGLILGFAVALTALPTEVALDALLAVLSGLYAIDGT